MNKFHRIPNVFSRHTLPKGSHLLPLRPRKPSPDVYTLPVR